MCMLYDSYPLVLVPPRNLIRTTNKETMIGVRRSVLKSRNRTEHIEKEGDGVATIVGHSHVYGSPALLRKGPSVRSRLL